MPSINYPFTTPANYTFDTDKIEVTGGIAQLKLTISGGQTFNEDFADDTGLEVDALNGAPGVYSARYAGEQRDANANMNKLLNELESQPNRTAQFKTVIALQLNGKLHTFTGICEGEIITSKKGNKGFGYDPIFQPNDYSETFAEISLEEKNRIGHRGKAVQLLVQFLNSK